MDAEMRRLWEVSLAKEDALHKIVAWLKGKGLWEECNRDLRIVAEQEPSREGDNKP